LVSGIRRIDLSAPSLVVCGDAAKAKEVAHRLASGIWTHDFQSPWKPLKN
jgi:hypothetical protein